METNLDLLDKKILNSLNYDCRATYSQIAREVRSSKEVINYRIQRLIKQGIIKGFVTIFGFGYWSYKLLVDFSKIDIKKETEILEYLRSHPNINWVTPCSGGYDLVFSIMAKGPDHFDKLLRGIMGDIGNFIRDYKVATSISSQTFGHTYILGKVNEPDIVGRKFSAFEFDNKDKEIAKLLHTNARIALTEISQKTNIPIDTVTYRIKKMERSGIIRRYRVILDPQKLGYHRYEIFLRCINLSDSIIAKFKEYARQNPNIEYFSRCVGAWDIEFTVYFKTSDELRGFILEVKERFGEHIQKFETITLFETHNFVYLPEELR